MSNFAKNDDYFQEDHQEYFPKMTMSASNFKKEKRTSSTDIDREQAREKVPPMIKLRGRFFALFERIRFHN